MTADVVSLADHRTARRRRAEVLAAATRHPSSAGTGLAHGRHLVIIGTGRTAHVVQWHFPVPADTPAGRHGGAHIALATYCGRNTPAPNARRPDPDTTLCTRCTNRLLTLARTGQL